MKKILAIVLTLAMLLSMVAVSASAATRESYKDDDTENKYWHFPQGNSWHPVKFSNPGTEIELDIKLDDASSALGCYGLSNAPSIGASYVGLKDGSISVPYTFTPGEWYNVKWVSAEGSTEIFVNGASVGTVGAEITYYDNNQFYWSPVLLSMDNVKMGGQVFDFEGNNDAWCTESGQGEVLIETFAGAEHNELVGKADNHYWHFQQGNSWHPVKFSNPGTEIELDIKLDDASSALGCYGLSNAPSIGASYVGLKDGSISVPYTFTPGEWYNVKWVSAEGSTEIFVNGASVGTVGAEITYYDNNQFYWSPVLVSMDNVKMGGQVFDFEGDNSAWNTESGQGELLAEEVEMFREDLGAKYWHFQQGNSWHPVKFSNPGTEIELAICLDDANSSLGCYGLSNAPSIGASYVGLKDGSISVPYTFTPGEWYNVKWVSAEGSTEIFVNGASVGTVGAEITYYDNNQFYWSPVLLSMDNVKMGGQVFDFEGNNDAWNTESGQGELMEYPPAVLPTIFDTIGDIAAPEGEGLLLSNSYDAASTYYDIETAAGTSKDVILDFNLKLISMSSERVAMPNHWYEFWLDSSCHNRVQIGVDALGVDRNGSADKVAFNFGENTWHRVTVEIRGSYNTLNIYIDGEKIYADGTVGEMHWLNGKYLIGQAVGANCLLDNYTVYDAKTLEVQTEGFGSAVDKTINERKVDDVDNPCNAAYGWHLPAATVIDTVETCYSEGKDVTTCAACGETTDHTIGMIAHKWSVYDINRKTADGLVYNYCRNEETGVCRGCTARHYTTIPNYEGTLYQYFDMQDDFILNCNNGQGWIKDNWTIADGVAKFNKYGGNYNQYDFNHEYPTNNWSFSFDIVFDSIYDDEHAGYGDEVYFWFGGNNSIAIQAGYQFKEWYTTPDQSESGVRETGRFFIRPNDGGSFQAQYADYELEFGRKYRFGVSFEYDEDEYTGAVKLWLDGEVVCQYTDAEDEEIIFVIPYAGSTHTFNIWRDFGVVHSLDNMAYASADFKILPRLGDVNLDDYVSAADVVVYRRYFSGHADAAELIAAAEKEADYNQDDAINAKDLLAVRVAIAA